MLGVNYCEEQAELPSEVFLKIILLPMLEKGDKWTLHKTVDWNKYDYAFDYAN